MAEGAPVKKVRKSGSAKQAVLKVVRRLQANGYQALLAGGCVRDMLLGKAAHDYDVATDARPEAVMGLFRRSLSVGARFGVVVVPMWRRHIEVATFRSDLAYVDGRRPSEVVFTDARTDASRRDFTINGMFLDPVTNEVIDYVGGRADLDRKLLRAIGKADERFAEDHLRMLRAVRFASRLGFEIDEPTWTAIGKHAAKIKRISAERIAGEIERILSDPNRGRGLALARESGLLGIIFETVSDEQLTLGIKVVGALPERCSYPVALAGLLAGCSSSEAGSVCRGLKTSNDLRGHVKWLVGNYREVLRDERLSRGELKQWLAEPLFEPLMLLARCYLKAVGQGVGPLRRLRRQIAELGDEPISPARLLDGHELIKLGAKPGPMVGQLGEELYLAQLENQVHNVEQAEKWVKQWLKRHQQVGPNKQ